MLKRQSFISKAHIDWRFLSETLHLIKFFSHRPLETARALPLLEWGSACWISSVMNRKTETKEKVKLYFHQLLACFKNSLPVFVIAASAWNAWKTLLWQKLSRDELQISQHYSGLHNETGQPSQRSRHVTGSTDCKENEESMWSNEQKH